MSGNGSALRMITTANSTTPPSFNGDLSLYGFNLFLMTAMFFLGLMLAGRQASRIWAQRQWDHPLDPVTLYRLVTLLAAIAVMLRCGAEALLLWGWSPTDPELTKRVVMAKRWIDPAAVACGFVWMSIVMLGEPGIEHQLRKAPLPVDMWSRWPTLVRALGVLVLSMIMALAAVLLR